MRNRTCSSGNNNIIAYNKVVRYCVTDTSVLIAVGCQPLNIAHTVSLSVCLSLSLSLSLSVAVLATCSSNQVGRLSEHHS